MNNYLYQRKLVIALQKEISRFNHQLENPKATSLELMEIQEKKWAKFQEWDTQIKILRQMPEHGGFSL